MDTPTGTRESSKQSPHVAVFATDDAVFTTDFTVSTTDLAVFMTDAAVMVFKARRTIDTGSGT